MRGSPKNIVELIAALERFKKGKGNFKVDDRALFDECRSVFQKLKILSDFDPDNLEKVIERLDKLPKDIKELEIGELDTEIKDLESKALNKEDLKQLIEDYEKAENGDRKEEIGEEIYRRTGKRNVEEFIKTQREIAAKNAERLGKASEKTREKVSEDLTKIKLDKSEEVSKVIDKVTFDEKITQRELEKKLKRVIKDPEEVLNVIREIEGVRAELKVESRAEEIARRTFERLAKDEIPVPVELETELSEKILESWKKGEELELPKELAEKSDDISVIETIREAQIFKEDNLGSVVSYRAIELGKEIGQELRKSGVRDEKLIDEYVSVVNLLTNNPQTARLELDKEKVVTFVESRHEPEYKFAVQPEIAVEEAQFMAKNILLAPKKFNTAIRRYNEVRELIGAEKLPKIKEVRVMEKMANMFAKNPQVLKLMNGAQKMVSILEKVSSVPERIMMRLGVQEVGLKLIAKIGGQAAVDFVTNAAAVIAEQGTLQGIKSIALGIMGKGAVVAGEAAAAGGTAAGSSALASAVAAFQALPVVGQVILVIVAAIMILKPLINGIKNILGKVLGIDMNGVKHFLSDSLGLGGFVGGVGQFVFDVGAFLIGIPTLFSLMTITALVTPVVLFFFLGVFVYSMFQHNLVSSIVPPADMGNCVLKSEVGGGINCDPNAPENSWPAVDKANFVDVANRWMAGTNFAETCYNDVVNRALCAGINPTYALWTWLHESGASNYYRDDIEDFGIHFIPENKNFNAQITEFLKLDPGSACINDPRIGGDYWLAFSANFLNGDCDPDKPNPIAGTTPRQYAAELRETWTWISNSPIPNSIHVSKGGQNCGSIGENDAPLPGGAREIVDGEGNVWICTENTQSPGTDYDPNAPGLGGVIVDGECSVGDAVVMTKQCDPQWGSTQLSGGSCNNGAPGTICSAGCGPTSVSMMMRRVNGSLTPKTVIFSSGSAYAGMGCEGSSMAQAKTELVKKFGSGAVTYDGTTISCDEKAIAKWICAGKVVMVLANFYRNSSLDLGGHFVLAIGVRDGKIVVADPYYDKTDTPFDGTRAYGYAHEIRECLLVEKSAIK
ncbi:MAG TPA: C39 family peptidase [Candidatus Methanoperedens sp.]|nr:C39 family peptidase [Candidatus Methanoperedens sp.]